MQGCAGRLRLPCSRIRSPYRIRSYHGLPVTPHATVRAATPCDGRRFTSTRKAQMHATAHQAASMPGANGVDHSLAGHERPDGLCARASLRQQVVS